MLRASSKAFFFVSCFNLKTTTTDKNSWEGLKKWLDFNMSTIIENISANVVLHGPPLPLITGEVLQKGRLNNKVHEKSLFFLATLNEGGGEVKNRRPSQKFCRRL